VRRRRCGFFDEGVRGCLRPALRNPGAVTAFRLALMRPVPSRSSSGSPPGPRSSPAGPRQKLACHAATGSNEGGNPRQPKQGCCTHCPPGDPAPGQVSVFLPAFFPVGPPSGVPAQMSVRYVGDVAQQKPRAAAARSSSGEQNEIALAAVTPPLSAPVP